MPPWGQCDLLLCKHLDLVSDHVDAATCQLAKRGIPGPTGIPVRTGDLCFFRGSGSRAALRQHRGLHRMWNEEKRERGWGPHRSSEALSSRTASL
jgi:hypothetical protein